jgi:hypothetical protein
MQSESPETNAIRSNRAGLTLKRWSERENNFLRTYYHAMRMSDMQHALRRSMSSIMQQAGVLGLWGSKRLEVPALWSEEEESVLKLYYPDNGLDLCSKFLVDRTPESIAMKVRRLGLKRRNGPRSNQISNQERDFIMANVQTLGFVECAKEIGDTPDNLREKCSRKGIDCKAIDRAFNCGEFKVGEFSDSEISIIKKHFYMEGGVRVAQLLGRSPTPVINFAKRSLKLSTVGPSLERRGYAPPVSVVSPVIHYIDTYEQMLRREG